MAHVTNAAADMAPIAVGEPHKSSAAYVEAIFAFEVQKDPWQMQLVDFCPYPTPEGGEEFLNSAYDAGYSLVLKHAGNPEENRRWGCVGQEGPSRAKLLVEFACDLYLQWQTAGLSVPSEPKGEAK